MVACGTAFGKILRGVGGIVTKVASGTVLMGACNACIEDCRGSGDVV